MACNNTPEPEGCAATYAAISDAADSMCNCFRAALTRVFPDVLSRDTLRTEALFAVREANADPDSARRPRRQAHHAAVIGKDAQWEMPQNAARVSIQPSSGRISIETQRGVVSDIYGDILRPPFIYDGEGAPINGPIMVIGETGNAYAQITWTEIIDPPQPDVA